MLDLYVNPWDEFDADDERRRARDGREHGQTPAVVAALVMTATGLMSVLLGSAWPMLMAPLVFLAAMTVTG